VRHAVIDVARDPAAVAPPVLRRQRPSPAGLLRGEGQDAAVPLAVDRQHADLEEPLATEQVEAVLQGIRAGQRGQLVEERFAREGARRVMDRAPRPG
jgi:hypothetical protein